MKPAGNRDKRITFLIAANSQDPDYGTQSTSWVPYATVWAEVQDMLPSRAERVAEGINLARRPSRIRMLYRDDITSDMRVKIGNRTLQIVAGPAELGRREEIEIVAEELSTMGQQP